MAAGSGNKGGGSKGGGAKGGAKSSAAKSTPSGRHLSVRVKTARRRNSSSTRWLQRQLNDPYVISAKKDGYRSRAAYKLLQLGEKFHLLNRNQAVVDLGAAPGGWTQVILNAQGYGAGTGGGTGGGSGGASGGLVIAVDVTEMDAMAGAQMLVGDVMDLETEATIRDALSEGAGGPAGGRADLVLSDMAPPATGHQATDHLRIIALAEAALDLAKGVLAEGGGFVAKVWQGGAEQELLKALKRDFKSVRHAKPAASRSDSAEMYVVATGYRGGESTENDET